MAKREGWKGWDAYAPFYDWENARTLGRRDVPFWRNVALRQRGPVLELGCGTGRISLPLARAGVAVVGIDRSAPMLERAAKRRSAQRKRQTGRRKGGLQLVRGDIRFLPFERGSFRTVLAPYGILQSLVREKDLTATLGAVADVLAPGGLFGVDLVPDVPNWREYSNRIQLKGRAAGGSHLTLIESVRQERKKHLTIFEQTYIERRGSRVTEHTFDLTFRTLPIPAFTKRLEKAGFRVEAVLGDYRGGPWDARADVWIMLARRL
ncbi:MAG TPA: class I SAM-dependent methyltransferase [Vicinamibacterales bacterium]|nr:class I SAM-dependent methyltransferase [Vicinamibacterales bacterium]